MFELIKEEIAILNGVLWPVTDGAYKLSCSPAFRAALDREFLSMLKNGGSGIHMFEAEATLSGCLTSCSIPNIGYI